MKELRPLRASASLILFLFTLVYMVFTQQSTKCVALLTELRGEVLVKPAHGSEFKKAAWGTQLTAGDIVKTAQAGSAFILFANNSLIELGPGSSMTVAGAQGNVGTKSRTVVGIGFESTVDLSSLTMRATNEGETIALAGLRAGATDQLINQLSPRKSSIRSLRPMFIWQSNIQADKFRVKLFSKQGLLWAHETEKTTLEYPATEKPLQRGGEYFWQVEGLALVETYQSSSIGFNVLSNEASQQIEKQERALKEDFLDNPSSPSLDFLAGTLYQQRGLLEESLAKFEAIAQRYPDAPAAFEVLGKLYTDIGLKDKAIAALQRALKLTQQQ